MNSRDLANVSSLRPPNAVKDCGHSGQVAHEVAGMCWGVALVLFVILASILARPTLTRAQSSPACGEPRITFEGALAERWAAPVAELCQGGLASMSQTDSNARLRFVAAGEELFLEVQLSDGREALRHIRAPESLKLTVEAVLTVLPAEERPVATTPVVAPPPPPVALPARPVPVRTGVGIEVGVAGGTRVAFAPLYVFVGGLMYAGVRAAGWLLALNVRLDAEQLQTRNTEPRFELEAVGAGMFVTRRVYSAGPADFELGPAASVIGESETVGSTRKTHTDSTTDLRVGIVGRLLLGRGALRFLTTLDTELSPVRLSHDRRLESELPKLPMWSLGLAFGVCWRDM